MAKEYNIGDRLYLPVWVTEKETNVMMGPDKSTTITDAKFAYTYMLGQTKTGVVRYGEEGLLLTAEEVAQDVNTERDDALAELKSRNAELEALLKEVMATRDEAIRQNNELIAENKKLKDGADKLKDTLVDRTKDVQHLTEENAKLKADLDQRNKDFWAMKKDRDELDSIGGKLRAENEKLKADNERLNAYYMEANRTASEAAEANDELKAKIADLRNRVGEQLAQIQDLNAEVHFHKEFGEGLDKQQKELQARYDELDSVNKEQAEKIRTLEKALIDLTAQPEEDKKKSAHVVLNDGTEIEFRRNDIQVFYRTDIDILVINDGDEVIAGFDRGDNPTNFAYFFIG